MFLRIVLSNVITLIITPVETYLQGWSVLIYSQKLPIITERTSLLSKGRRVSSTPWTTRSATTSSSSAAGALASFAAACPRCRRPTWSSWYKLHRFVFPGVNFIDIFTRDFFTRMTKSCLFCWRLCAFCLSILAENVDEIDPWFFDNLLLVVIVSVSLSWTFFHIIPHNHIINLYLKVNLLPAWLGNSYRSGRLSKVDLLVKITCLGSC